MMIDDFSYQKNYNILIYKDSQYLLMHLRSTFFSSGNTKLNVTFRTKI